jgi:hypothetical protein
MPHADDKITNTKENNENYRTHLVLPKEVSSLILLPNVKLAKGLILLYYIV